MYGCMYGCVCIGVCMYDCTCVCTYVCVCMHSSVSLHYVHNMYILQYNVHM